MVEQALGPPWLLPQSPVSWGMQLWLGTGHLVLLGTQVDVLGHGGDSFHEGGPGWQPVTSFLYCMEGSTVGTTFGAGTLWCRDLL